MELFLNDQSLHGQYRDRSAFARALARVMEMRRVARSFDRDVYCYSALLDRNAFRGAGLRKAVGSLPRDQQRAVMWWLTRGGPFWWLVRRHSGDDFLESRGDIVTDSAIGEAAFRALLGDRCGLLSFFRSDWNESPIRVIWRREAEGYEDQSVQVDNFWTTTALEEALLEAMPPIRSWDQVRPVAERTCPRLTFGAECFSPLRGLPFSIPGSTRILELLRILDRFAGAFNPDGTRSPAGHRMYQDYFTGDSASFSDSSPTEKRHFGSKLRFPHPDLGKPALSCTWHGKIRTMFLRVHFTWPIRYQEPVYVMYIGRKITVK